MTLEQLARARGLHLQQHADAAAQAEWLACRVADQLRKAIAEKGCARMALSGGRSPQAFLRQLARQSLDWSRTGLTLVDERWVDQQSADSNAALLRDALAEHWTQLHWLPLYRGISLAADAEQASAEVQAWLPFDVVVLGMGVDGHCASLFADDPQLAHWLDSDSAPLCAPVAASGQRLPRLTLTPRALVDAGLQLLAISGEDKRATVQQALAGVGGLPVAALLQPSLTISYSPAG